MNPSKIEDDSSDPFFLPPHHHHFHHRHHPPFDHNHHRPILDLHDSDPPFSLLFPPDSPSSSPSSPDSPPSSKTLTLDSTLPQINDVGPVPGPIDLPDRPKINPEPHISSQFYTFNSESHSLMITCLLEGRLATPVEIRSVTPVEVLKSWRSVWKDRNEDTAYLTAWKRIQDKLHAHVDPANEFTGSEALKSFCLNIFWNA